jgi:hypothetical protein
MSRRALAWMAFAALLLTLPSFLVGFLTDDHAFRAMLHHGRPWWDLFRFPAGPWWSASNFKLHFLRPLAGLSLALDDMLFGDHAAGYHLQSIVWYVALVLAVGLLYRRVLPGASGVFALLVFAFSHAHVMPYAWISARHLLVGALPAVLALYARLSGRRPWLAPLLLVLGLAGSEAALGGVCFWLAYETATRRSWRAAAAPLALLAGYALVYKLFDAGARGSGAYHDPASDPLGFVRAATTNVPALLGDALLGVPTELAHRLSGVAVGLIGLAACALVGLALWSCRQQLADEERAALRWLVPGALAATLIGAAGFAGGRVLLLPDLGFAALLGVILRHGLAHARRPHLGFALAALLALVHLVLAPLSSLRATHRLVVRARTSQAVADGLARELPPHARVFLIAASDPLVFLYPRGILADTAPETVRCWSVLSAAHAPHRLTRTGPRSFDLQPLGHTLLEGPFETLFRAPDRPIRLGDTFFSCGARVRVIALREGRPARLAIEFATPLEQLSLYEWREGRLARFTPPPLHESVELPES